VNFLQSSNISNLFQQLGAASRWPLVAAPMLTPREQDFYRVLWSAYPHHLVERPNLPVSDWRVSANG
jgi:hypothetical protein